MTSTFINNIVCNTINGRSYGMSSGGDVYEPFYSLRVSLGITNRLATMTENTINMIFQPGEPFELAKPEFILTPLDGSNGVTIYDDNNNQIPIADYSFKFNTATLNMTIIYNRKVGAVYKVIYESATGPTTSGGLVQFNSDEAARSTGNIILESALVPPLINSVSNSIVIGLDNNLSPPEGANVLNSTYTQRKIKCQYDANMNVFTFIKGQYELIYGPYILSHCLGLFDTAAYEYTDDIILYFDDGTIYGKITLDELSKIYVNMSELIPGMITVIPNSRVLANGDVLSFTLFTDKGTFVDKDGGAYINNVAIGQANILVGGNSISVGNNNRGQDSTLIFGNNNTSEVTNILMVGSNNTCDHQNNITLGFNLFSNAMGINIGNFNTISNNIRSIPEIKQTPDNDIFINKLKINFIYKTPGVSNTVYDDQIYVYETISLKSHNIVNNVNNPSYGYYIVNTFSPNLAALSYPKTASFMLWSILSQSNPSLIYNENTILPPEFTGEPVITTPGGYTIDHIDYANGLFFISSPSGTVPDMLDIEYYRLKYENAIYNITNVVIGSDNDLKQPNSFVIGNANTVSECITYIPDEADSGYIGNNTVIGTGNAVTNATQSLILGANNIISNLDDDGNEIGQNNINTSNGIINSYHSGMENCVNSTFLGCRNITLTGGQNTTLIGIDSVESNTAYSIQDCVIMPGLMNTGKTIKTIYLVTNLGPTLTNDIKKYTDIFINTIDNEQTSTVTINIDLNALDNTPGRVYNLNLLLTADKSVFITVASNITLYVKNTDPVTGKAAANANTHNKYTGNTFANLRDSFALTCMNTTSWLLNWI